MFSWLFGAREDPEDSGEEESEEQQEVRTAKHGSVASQDALQMLKDGNKRYAGEKTMRRMDPAHLRETLCQDGQNPFAAILGCADSRCPLETLFDAQPGDLFVLRNAGNAVTHPEGSIIGSMEFCTGALGTKLILVLGHTKCGAMTGATNAMLGKLGSKKGALESYLTDLAPVAREAQQQLKRGAPAEEIAAQAIEVNVFNSMQRLLEYSAPLRTKVASGALEIHGGIYDIVTGKVKFLGTHPRTHEIITSMVRTAKHDSVPAGEALELLKEGNKRYTSEHSVRISGALQLRTNLAEHGQKPMAAIIGCADSRCPLETLFDAQPGDLFVCRNAGNAVTHPNGSVVGSIEFCVGALGTKLVLVLGHTKCGAMTGATNAALGKLGDKKGALEKYLMDLAPVAQQAMRELPAGSSTDEIAARAIRVNVFNTIQKLMEFSAPLREKVASGEVEVHGGVYDIATGDVEFLGQHPQVKAMVTSGGPPVRAVGA